MQIDPTQLNYWQKHLENAPAMLALPTDKQRQADTTPQKATHSAFVSAQIVPSEMPATLHLLAAYTLLLLRHSQQDDIVLGTAVSHHLLPLRTKITPDTTFAQLVDQLTQAHQQAQHHILPLPALVENLQPAYDESYAPLFQAAFAASKLPETPYTSLYDLILVVSQETDGWRCCWQYRADLFTEQHIQQFATHFETLLRSAADHPDCSAMDLAMMPPAEQELLLHTWNQTALDVPQDLCLHEWIAQQAAKSPQRTAVSDNHASLTYAELDRQSGQLATYLRQQGVQPGVVVAFSLARTVKVLVTLLGILKAGGTYLPLTAAFPAERIQFMLDDARAQLLLTESQLAQELPKHLPLIELDSQWEEIASLEPLTGFHYPPQTTAYIIYTSGSTGVPKGVPISQRNIVNLTASMLQEPGMSADDKFLAITALSFDILGYELYSPLVVGGEVVVASEKMMRDGHLLSDRLAKGDITFLQGTPVTWQMLLAADWPGTPNLKMISCGEALTRHLATQLLARGAALWNLYGPTEATIFATGHRVISEEIAQLNRDDLPIGRPVHNMQAYILDDTQRLLPIGAIGELYLGGAGLSQGYLYREELTAERFIPHPFSDDPNAKLYRTGDLARYQPDGIIEYLGRTDYQVKVHGFRIELGEIESRLEELTEVQTAVAIAWVNPANNDKHLVAYFVSPTGETVDTEQIRNALKTTLPSYMVPGILMQLPQLPATPNGKVDRKALPTPLETRKTERPYTAPRNSLEEQLAKLWAELFSVKRVGIHDSFLDMGGHSLLATHLISSIQSALGVRLSVGDLFRHETIAELAAVVANSSKTEAVLTAASAAAEEKHLLSFAQRRLWFSYKLDPQSPAYSEPIAIRLRGPLNATWLQQSLTELVTRHEVLRTVYFEDGDVYGRIQAIDQLPLPVLDLRHLPAVEQETAVSQQIAQEDQRPFNLTSQIPIRTKLLHLSEDHWVLLLNLHHIAMDLWSIELIIEEITTIYRAYQVGKMPQLLQLPIQYKDYAAWQETWLAEHEAEHLAYWQDTLAPDPEPLQLLTDNPRGEKPSDEGANFAFQLPDEVMQQTNQFMQKERVTLFTLLLATYQALMHRYTQQAEINIGIPIANRHRPHTEKLIGFFTNTIVMNASFTPGLTFHQLLGQVWERVLGGQDHQDLPFNKVVEAVQTTRRENVPPLFQTFFTVQAIEGRPEIPGIQIEPVYFETQTVKFDLTLSLSKLKKQINGFVEYRAALFSPERIALLGNHYVNLLAQLMTQPDTPIDELDFRTEEEQTKQAGTAQTAVLPQSLSEKFTEIAKRFGPNTAVSTPTSNLTYQQLHQQSNQIAQLLLEHNIQPGDVVAIYATPTPQMVTAVFGVLKVGAVYLPLNEGDPQAWQQMALQNSGAKLLLYSGTTSPVSDLTSCPQLAIETAQSCATDDIAASEGGGICLPSSGCYPVADLFHLAQVYPIQANNQVLQFAPFASHPATHEIFATLLNGGTLHLAPKEQLTKLSTLIQLLNDRQIDFAILPAVLIAALDPKRVPHLKTAVCLEADMDQTHWQKWAGRQRLHGHLSTASVLPTVLSQIEIPEAWLSGTAVPAITLLSSQGQPTPTGVLGTLHIGKPAQSTNDSWCWLRDGRIQFRHYHPTHTTTRGRYVQTDAIAAVLRQYPTVENCIVLPDGAACEKRLLTAYVVPAGVFDLGKLTQFAQQQLPAQLVPAQFQTVAQIPLLPSGQIDFQALQHSQQQETVQDQKADIRAAKQSDLAKRRQNLSAKQQALLDKWQQKKTDDNNSQQLIAKQQGDQSDVRRPLSFAQQRLFLLDQLEPNQSTYNIPLVFQVDGRLDEAALQTVVDTLYERHDSLRTTFYFGDDGEPYQQVAPNSQLPIERVDFSALPEETREKEVAVWIQNEAKRPFNLTTGPLIRMAHLKLAQEKHILVIVMHHIISDGWSVAILFQEMAALYAAFVQKRPSPLTPLPIQYADFATWQRDWLQGEVLQQQINYWQETLQGAPAVLTLPTDRPRPAMQSYRGATLHTQLPSNLMPAVKQLAQAENASPFMVLLAAFQLLLARYTQQEDIVVGTPIANRNRTEIEGLIGFFVNMLVLRTNTSGNPTFRTLLSQVRNTTLGAFAHQDIPFEKLVEERQVARDLSYSPLFQVAFILQNTPRNQVSLPGLTFSLQNAPNTTSKFDLTLELTETAVGFQAAWEYSTDLFDESTITRLANHFSSLVQQIAAQPDAPIDQFDIITPAEKALMQQWNNTERPFPEHLCLHQLLSQQAVKTPQRTAVSDGQTALTYQQLETQSNQLAHHLIALGVKPNTFVAVALDRTAQLPIALWGILKAGGAYLPVDPAFPAQRIQFMLTDAQAPLLLSQKSIADKLPPHQAQVLRLDELLPTLTDLPTTLPETAVTPHNLAYIIYTSGSTGRPKGVQIHHRSLVNLLTSMMDKPGIAPDDKLLAITTLSFDIATVELYLPLLAGAQVVIAPQSALTDPQQLIDLLQENAITLMQATPATWQMLISGNWQGHPGLSMITGGEALSVTLAQQLLARGQTLWNMYAPSETTTYSTIQPVLAEELDPQQSIPIGHPLANTQLYILDGNLKPVPIGVTGELYIGGVGVASGYLNQPDLTAERFIQLPVVDNQLSDGRSPTTVYRTGDLASFRPDGAVNFLGRSDHQVKIRGFRVELGEIESRLRQHPAIAQAVVHPFEQQLVAYLIFEPDLADASDVSTAVLRTFIQETLPAYMVPHIFMPLEAFPLTPNGKVDRKALPSPTGERDATTTFVAPRNAIEAQLAEIWQDLLPIDQVGVQDNFFELGGHSLLATQLVSRIQKQFNLKLPLRDVFEQSTIAQIASLIEKSGATTSLGSQPFIPKLPDGQPLPLSFAQRRLLVMDQLDPDQATYNIPLAFKLDGHLDETALQTAVNILHTRHHALRTTFYFGEDGQPYQQIATETHLPIEQVDFSALPEETRGKEVAIWIQNEAKRPFNLTTGPLIRIAHLRLAEKQHILVIVMHHIITDGWSMTLFVREFVNIYISLVKELPLNLPALRVQYADFAAWQQNWLQGDVLEQQLAYWQDQLAGTPPVLSLPTDFPRPKLQSTRGENHNQLLPKALTPALTQFSQTHNSTLFMTLLTAYNILLLRYTQQKDFVVGTPIANRNHPDIENIIGFFVNMLPLRIQIGEAETFSTLLEQVRQTALDAYQHQDIPFEQVVHMLQPVRDTSHSPIFQVSFVLQNANAALPQLNELSLTPLTAESKTAKYDLTLGVTETNNGLLCTWEYSTELFLPETIARMHTHFETLLQAIVQTPDLSVTRLPILPATEKQLLLDEWQGKSDPSIPQMSLSQRFEEWAAKQPEVTAVSDNHLSLTYQQLNQRANQLARLLVIQGVQPGNAVGIHMGGSVPAIVTILACHKVRAAYVPFDPAYPTQRLQFMLDDTAAPIIITDSSLEHLDTGGCTIWQWDAIQTQLNQQAADNLDLVYAPSDPAYIIYTSGSTGQPKGVVCGHRGVFNLLRAFDQWGELAPQASSSLWTSLNFDVAVYEIFAPLVSGGTLQIVPAEIRTEALTLFYWLAEQHIASVYLPPFMVEPFAAWLKEDNAFPALQRLLVGVEPLAEQTLVTIQKQLPQAVIINGYGPTEATVCTTAYRISADSQRAGIAPLGHALLNTQHYLLDEDMQPVPIGVPGELYIGGTGLAYGYLNRPDLTAEKFVPNPFANDPAAKLYRTGDLVRYLSDGNILFIGRTDFQLKVRGFRIELGEIESHLLAQPGVTEGVVVPHTATDGQITLVAYFTVEPDDPNAPEQYTLRDALNQALPSYMVPAVWIQLDQMPRTPNDKIDRKALPAPNMDALERSAPFEAPRTPIEEHLQEIWQSLLATPQISIHDNFFELGGHSLLATQLISQIQKTFKAKLPLREVFERGTIAELADLIETSQAQAELLAIPMVNTADRLPVSFAQQRLLVLDQLDPNQETYNVPMAVQIDGRINKAALQTAVDSMYTRHDSLRTSFFYNADGQPYQQITDKTHLPLTQLDLSHLPETERDAKAKAWLEEEAKRPFNLTTGPLIRIAHLRLAEEQHILIIVMHHIITDGWSMSIFLREFLQIYSALMQNRSANLPEMAIQYADFATWQQNWLQGDVLAQQIAYWQNHLSGAPAVLKLPTDMPRPKIQNTRGNTYEQQLSPALTAPLAQLSHTHNSTLFMTLFAAYNLLLARYSHQDDIVVGTPIANRNQPGIENLIGFFVNMLPLRTQFEEADTFSTLLEKVRQTVLDAYNHQDIPFEQVVNQLHPVRDTSYSPIFQVSFTLQNSENTALPPLAGLKLTPLTTKSKTAKYDLTLGVTKTNNGLVCTWEYGTDLFLPETIARMHTHFETLLHSIVNAPHLAITRLPILPQAEKQLLLHEWQGEHNPSIPQMSLSQRFEEWAAKQPEVTAVSDPITSLTYNQLNQRANQLARLLIDQGVQPGDAIGIHMGGSVPAIVAILASHKARAAYVPFDPAYPDQRLQFMLNDTATPVILTDTSLEHLDTGSCTIWQWHEIQPQLDKQPPTNLSLAHTPSDPAYIIYTSGSTGKPKGVVCGHRGVFNLLRAFDQWGELAPQASSSLWTSLNFDVAVYEIFAPLVSGGTLQIVPAEIRTEAITLFHWLAEQHIASVYLPPFMVEPFAAWLKEGNAFPALQRLLVGVEPLAEQTLVTIQKQLPQAVIINAYGPTEATVCATHYRVQQTSVRQGITPIGQPLLNFQVYLLDKVMQPVPIGVAGELYIGGLGLAHGYLNRPELTAEKFVPNPFSADPEARLYRTGDLARYLPDGNIMFIGRTDFQLKVRGFRIELGEIESHLLAQPGVTAGVVVPHTAADGQITLVAYFTVEPEDLNPANQHTLRTALNRVLPNYMVPAVWIQLDEMPRTPNDKIDRKALPAPNLDELNRVTAYAPPSTLLEERLVTLWENLLQVPKIGIHDNFFELGGHSLLATQLISQIQKTFKAKLPLREVFERGTIAELAPLVESSQAQTDMLVIPVADRTQPLPVSFAQQRLLVLDQLDPNQATYNISLAFKLDGRLDEAALQTAVNTLYTRHHSLRTTFYYGEDGQPYQRIAAETQLPIEPVDFSTLPKDAQEKEVAVWIQNEAKRPFSLTTGPLIRIAHLRLAEEQHILVIVMHHIITDGWSMSIFVREFLQLYSALAHNRSANLPEMAIQYADFAAWQQNWLQGSVLAQQLAYWQDHLADAPTVLSLPTDFPRPKLQSTRGNTYEQQLSPALTAPLAKLSHTHNSTLFMTLFAAYNLLLARYSHQDDIVVGTPIANRNQPGIENLIGFFVNMLPLRTQFEEADTFSTLLEKVRQTVLDAYNHQDIPFEQVVNQLHPVRDTSYSPIFQVSFTLQNSENTALPPLAGLKLTPLTTENKSAKYDLTLIVTETNSGLVCTWEYSTELFLPETIARMHTHFETLLQAIIHTPQLSVARLPLLPAAEKQLLLHEWQGQADSSIPQICLHEQFEQWVQKQPEVTAVSDEHLTLTYQQLNQRANQLAHLLIDQGVRPGDAVGIHLTASVPAIIIIMACHKARAAYVPFDPAYPSQRLQLMLDDTAAPVVLTNSSLDHLDTGKCTILPWDEIQQQLTNQPVTNLNLAYSPADPAYIIYTSGSTGKPKGVVCGHTGVFNLQRTFDQWGALPPQAIYSLWTSLNFDASVYEIFPAFITGGSLHIVPQEIRADPPRLFNWLADHQIQHGYLPPFMVEPFHRWLQEEANSCSLLRLMAGVEPLVEQTLVGIQQLVPGLTFINAYGPTETTVCATHYRVPPNSTRLGNAPIGQPLLNFQVYLLDEHMQPVPIGVAGELYVGGIGLAHGYLNRPELTAEKFVPDPFSTDPKARLYRTGDLVRYLPDGNIMFIGRTDFQLKVRGFRVELGEIESNLLAQDGVETAVVTPHTAADGQITLVAYFTVEPDAANPPNQQSLHDALNQALPNYMVPAVWVQLDKMPRTPNDKIDRNALPTPNLDEISRLTAYAPPRTLAEERLVTLWENLLQVPNIGIHDNFFSLGGHSLLAVQLITALRQQLDKDVPLRLLFDAPTIAELAQELKKLGDLVDLERIPKWSGDGPLPLSFAQQRLWFIAEMNPQANANYNVPIHLEIEGPLDLPALEYSFNQLFQRHESLRTRYPLTEEEMPYQEILPVTAVSLPITNLTDLPAAEKEAHARQLRQQSAQTPFDLKNGPIFRIQIVRLDKTRHQLLFTIHHIAFDAWSTNLFLSEIVAHYLHKTTGFQPKLPDSEVQYADFTLWQQARLTPEVLDEQLTFWREHLAHAPSSLALPTDKPRPQIQTSNGDVYEFTLPPELSNKVRRWTQSNRATLFMTLLTAFYGLLYRHANQEDIVVGTPIANRNHPDLKNVIGFFLNTMALRAHIEETMTWQDLLQQTRDTLVAAHDYQEYPFENLVQALLPDRDPSRHPLFQVMFVLQNQGDTGQVPAYLPIQFNELEGGTKTSKFDLLLDMQETAVGFTATFEYNTDLFNPSTIQRLAAHFQQMVTAMVSEPDKPIAQARLLTPQEQTQIDAWNDTAVPINPNELVHHRFEQQADATPQAVAALFDAQQLGNQQLTYAELEAKANQLAHFLQAAGVQPNDQVGIMIPRSLEMITAVLGILKAGAGYVPLDPDYPTDRIELMLDHADVKLLLTHSSLDQSDVGRSRHNVDELDLSAFGEERITAVINPEHTVYVIFTSGSTGTPKGVVLPHRALNNMLAWQKTAMHRQGPTRTLQFTSLSFDVHFQEMFSTWQAGGTLVLIPDDVRRDGEQLLAYLQKYQIERLFLPFVALHNLAEAAQWLDSYPDTLQEVITAGEALQSTPPIRDFFKRLPGCAFHNHYGPSESHVITQYTLGPDPDQWPDLPPIGTVIDNNKIHLLDANMRPVPIGVPGELYIGGLNLATGYINQPQLTAERFIGNPFTSDPQAKLYKTGDLARYLPDGNIQYLGRNDFQVKIRGHRVELGEIETVLNQQPTVQQAVVQAHKPNQGAHQLIAYIKTADETAVTTLPAILREKLPAYMVPAHFIRLDQFPLTPSGKINRRALPIPEKMEMIRVTPFAAPETPLQQQLAEIWERVLNVAPVGIHDNFFELGGHSLLAIRLVAAMQRATAVKLPLTRLFQEGTIAAIASYMSNPTAQAAHSPIVPLRPGSADQPPLIVIHPGSGQVLPYLGLVQALPKDQPVYGLQSMGLLPNTPAQTDIASMATSYLQALEAADIQRPYHLLGWSMGGVVAMEMAQQLSAAGQAVGSLTLIDTYAPSGEYDQPSATTLLQWFARDTGYLSPKIKPSLLPNDATIEDQLRHLWPQLQAAGNLPDELTWNDFEQQFAVFQANYAAMQAYGPRPFSQPVQLIVSKTSAKGQKDKWLGWQDYLEQAAVEVLRGNHFTLLQEPKTVKSIAQAQLKLLAQPALVRK